MHVALVIEQAQDVERLVPGLIGRSCSVTVIAMPPWSAIAAFAPLSGGTTPDLMCRAAVTDAARAAREAATALSAVVAARHLSYEGWQAPAFLADLRRGAFDTALFLAWPPWIHRRAVLRAARAGDVVVVEPAQPRRRSVVPRRRVRLAG